jgi:hypothetical protein
MKSLVIVYFTRVESDGRIVEIKRTINSKQSQNCFLANMSHEIRTIEWNHSLHLLMKSQLEKNQVK